MNQFQTKLFNSSTLSKISRGHQLITLIQEFDRCCAFSADSVTHRCRVTRLFFYAHRPTFCQKNKFMRPLGDVLILDYCRTFATSSIALTNKIYKLRYRYPKQKLSSKVESLFIARQIAGQFGTFGAKLTTSMTR